MVGEPAGSKPGEEEFRERSFQSAFSPPNERVVVMGERAEAVVAEAVGALDGEDVLVPQVFRDQSCACLTVTRG